MAVNKTSWHWSCASRYCKASWKTEGEYYTLTKVASASKPVGEAYLFVLGKTINEVNFKRQVICTQHWPKGVRKNLEDPPSIKYTNVQEKRLKKVVNIGTMLQLCVQTPGELNSRDYNTIV